MNQRLYRLSTFPFYFLLSVPITRLFTFAFSLLPFYFLLFTSCSVQKQISRQAHEALLDSSELSSAHTGISIFDAAGSKFLYTYQGDKYFIPASNTKLFTMYAALKHLGDSLVAARYKTEDSTVILQATGDPTFLHPDFSSQPLLRFLQQKTVRQVSINTAFASESYGAGWSWDDFEEPYMAERDPFPMYGNLATVSFAGDSISTMPPAIKQLVIGLPEPEHRWHLGRKLGTHFYIVDTTRGSVNNEKTVTMVMEKGSFAAAYLADTLHKPVTREYRPLSKSESVPLHSQPTDTVLKIMMGRSDNFLAEQSLLMVSNEMLGEMNDDKIIDTLLKTDFEDLPQTPRWVDGSGLSRYNLFSPNDFVYLLNKLKNEFGFERVKTILPGANQGTLEDLYNGYENHIYAKSGSLSNNLALSGYLVTRKNRTFLFSVMVNNHNASSKTIRKQIEKFLTGLIDRY